MNLFLKTTVIAVSSCVLLSSCSTKLEPLSDVEVQEFIKKDAEVIIKDRIKVERPISLYDAMAMVLFNNLDYKVQIIEQAVAQGQFEVAKLEMYPKLRANAGASHRSPGRASSSESVITGRQSLEPSTSEDADKTYGDLTFSWSIIDFGVSYYQAKQEANKVLIAKELRRRAFHSILTRVREAYWKAAASQKLKEKVDNIIVHVKSALRQSEKVSEQKLKPPLESLRFQRSLIDILRDMKGVKDDLEKAEIDLYQLLNLPVNKEYDLYYKGLEFNKHPHINVDNDTLVQAALLKRPELREEIYRSKISYSETKKALLRLLPGIELKVTESYDSNSFLVDQIWRNASSQITSNLMDVFNYKTRMNAAEIQEELSLKKRMALQLAIMSQVNLALKDYSNAKEKLEQAQKVSEIDEKIRQLVDISARNEAEIELERIKASASAVSTKLQEFQAYANYQNSYGRLISSIGYDIIDIDAKYDDIYMLSDHFKSEFASLDAYDIKTVMANVDNSEIDKILSKIY